MVVRMRRNRSQTAKRRSHMAISGVRLSKCECGALRRPHTACPSCGKYRGRVVIDVVARAQKEARRTKRRQADAKMTGRQASEKEPAAS